jgi:aspartyl-tRNA(Asn)/glutamyl-tRNA(Gln) amidotransferase subunit A
MADVDQRPWRIGVPVEYNIAELSPIIKDAWTAALEGCQKLNFEVVPISLPSTKSALSAYYVLAPAEASSNLARYDGARFGSRAEGPDGVNGILFSKTREQGFGNEVKRRILLGSYSLSADAIDNYFIQAQKVRRLVQKEFNHVFEAPHPLLPRAAQSEDFDWESGPGIEIPGLDTSNADEYDKVDFILCPTAPTPPPKLKDIEKQTPVESYINDVFTVPASMAGLPAISVPWGKNDSQDPSKNVGLQIIGQFGHDRQVLRMAKHLQRMQNPDVGEESEPHE